MAGLVRLVPAMHVFVCRRDVDARHRPAHDCLVWRETPYTVAAVPRITVACEDSTPPLPWAIATSQSLT